MRAVFVLLALLALTSTVSEARKGYHSYRPYRRSHHGKSFFGFAPKRAVVVVKRGEPERPVAPGVPTGPTLPTGGPGLPDGAPPMVELAPPMVELGPPVVEPPPVTPPPVVEPPPVTPPTVTAPPPPAAVESAAPVEPKVTAPPLPPVDGAGVTEPRVTGAPVDGAAVTEPRVTAPPVEPVEPVNSVEVLSATTAVEEDTTAVGTGTATTTGTGTATVETAAVVDAAGPVVDETCSSVVQTAVEAELNTLTAAATSAGLAGSLGADFVGTVFAPTEEAFAALLTDLGLTAEELLANTELLTTVLSLHVVPDVVAFAADLEDGQEIPTLGGAVLTVAISDAGVFIVAPSGVEAQVVSEDIEACDAVVHVIDKVLTPAE